MPTIKLRILAAAASTALSAGATHANSLTDTIAFPEFNAALTQSNPEIVLKLHGFLSRAQFECGFRSYSQQMTDFAVAAAAQMPSEKAVSALMADGMKSFDLGATHSSLRGACADLWQRPPHSRLAYQRIRAEVGIPSAVIRLSTLHLIFASVR